MDLMTRRRVMLAKIVELVKMVATSATGIVSFVTNIVRPVKVTCEFSPVQDGSGNPSPNNVRPISGWTGCNIYQSGADTSNPTTFPVSWETAAGTVYGGTVTLNEDGSVDLTDDRMLFTFDGSSDEDWTAGGWGTQARLYLTSSITNVVKIETGAKVTDAVANYFTFVSQNSNWNAKDNIISTTPAGYAYMRCDTIGAFENWRPYLAEHPITICFKRKTPLTYHFDNIGQLKSFLGENNIWHNLNGSITTEYWKKQ